MRQYKITQTDIALATQPLIRPGDTFQWKSKGLSAAAWPLQDYGNECSCGVQPALIRYAYWYTQGPSGNKYDELTVAIDEQNVPFRRLYSSSVPGPEDVLVFLSLLTAGTPSLYFEEFSKLVFANFLFGEKVISWPIASHPNENLLSTNEKIKLISFTDECFLETFSPVSC